MSDRYGDRFDNYEQAGRESQALLGGCGFSAGILAVLGLAAFTGLALLARACNPFTGQGGGVEVFTPLIYFGLCAVAALAGAVSVGVGLLGCALGVGGLAAAISGGRGWSVVAVLPAAAALMGCLAVVGVVGGAVVWLELG